jgi:hypothetical protein
MKGILSHNVQVSAEKSCEEMAAEVEVKRIAGTIKSWPGIGPMTPHMEGGRVVQGQ